MRKLQQELVKNPILMPEEHKLSSVLYQLNVISADDLTFLPSDGGKKLSRDQEVKPECSQTHSEHRCLLLQCCTRLKYGKLGVDKAVTALVGVPPVLKRLTRWFIPTV